MNETPAPPIEVEVIGSEAIGVRPCNSCGGRRVYLQWRFFSGGRHIRTACFICQRRIGFVPRTPEATEFANRNPAYVPLRRDGCGRIIPGQVAERPQGATRPAQRLGWGAVRPGDLS